MCNRVVLQCKQILSYFGTVPKWQRRRLVHSGSPLCKNQKSKHFRSTSRLICAFWGCVFNLKETDLEESIGISRGTVTKGTGRMGIAREMELTCGGQAQN